MAQGAAPANDAFSAATPLAVGRGLELEPGRDGRGRRAQPAGFAASDSCLNIAAGANCGTSVWYTFQPASSGQYTIGTATAART